MNRAAELSAAGSWLARQRRNHCYKQLNNGAKSLQKANENGWKKN